MARNQDPASAELARISPAKARGIIAIVAILPLVIAWFLSNDSQRAEFFPDIFADVGVVILGLLVVDLVWQLAGGEPIQNMLRYFEGKLTGKIEESRALTGLMAHVHRVGMHGIAENQDPLRLKLVQRIDDSKAAIDISGWSLYLLHEHPAVQMALGRAARRGVTVRIIMPSPTAEWLSVVNKPDIVDGVRSIATQVQAQLQSVIAAGAQVRLQDKFVIMASILRFDDFLQVMPYLVSETSSNSPRLQLHGPDSPLYLLWRTEFDYLFDQAKPLAAGGPPPPARA